MPNSSLRSLPAFEVRLRPVFLALMAAALLPGGDARAKSHLWDTTVVFSNAQGNIQFINMFVSDPAGVAEYQTGGKLLESDANSYIFPSDLPMTHSTFETWILIATQDYADLPGAPSPDFIMPPGFFDPAGDTIVYRSVVDSFTIPPGAMPTDGVHALDRDLNTPVNVGINFAGDFGTVTVPQPVPSISRLGIVIVAVGLATICLLVMKRASRLRVS